MIGYWSFEVVGISKEMKRIQQKNLYDVTLDHFDKSLITASNI